MCTSETGMPGTGRPGLDGCSMGGAPDCVTIVTMAIPQTAQLRAPSASMSRSRCSTASPLLLCVLIVLPMSWLVYYA